VCFAPLRLTTRKVEHWVESATLKMYIVSFASCFETWIEELSVAKEVWPEGQRLLPRRITLSAAALLLILVVGVSAW